MYATYPGYKSINKCTLTPRAIRKISNYKDIRSAVYLMNVLLFELDKYNTKKLAYKHMNMNK